MCVCVCIGEGGREGGRECMRGEGVRVYDIRCGDGIESIEKGSIA